MPTSTPRTQKQDTVVEPLENQMFSREGFDRRGIRRELANVGTIALDDLYVEQSDREFVDPRTLDLPFGPTGMGETGGTGSETIRVGGERYKTIRYVTGFEYLEEDDSNLGLQRDANLEMLDLLADANFLTGITDKRDGSQIEQGVFDWLKSAIPADRTFDATDYADGTVENYDNDGVEENLIKYDAYKQVSGRILDNNDATWDAMVGRQEALASFNKISGAEGGLGGQSYWQRLNDPDAIGGVRQQILIPDELQPSKVPQSENLDPLTVDLTAELDNDEVILLPDLGTVRDEFWNVYEMPSPETFTGDERGGQNYVDYAWRFAMDFDPLDLHEDATDAVRIQNVSELFG